MRCFRWSCLEKHLASIGPLPRLGSDGMSRWDRWKASQKAAQWLDRAGGVGHRKDSSFLMSLLAWDSTK